MIGPKTGASWYLGQVNGFAVHTNEGGLELPLVNRWPDRLASDLGPDGSPAGWEAVLPNEPVAYHVQESRPGKRTESFAPQEEKEPPRADTMTRQTEAPVPLSDAWTANQPGVSGFSPYHHRTDPHAEDAEPLPAPEVEAVAVASGYAGGLTLVTFTLGNENGETTSAGYASVALAAGEGYRLYLPEGLQAGARGPLSATTFNVYQGLPNRGQSTAVKQESFLLEDLQEPFVEMTGPYEYSGKRPPVKNKSGVGRPKQPGGHNPNRPRFAVRKTNGNFELQEADVRVGWQIVKGPGRSLVSQWSREKTTQKEKGKALVIRPARSLKEGERWVPWVTVNDVPHRVYAKRGGFGESESYGPDEEVEVYLYSPDAEPRGLKDGLYQVDPPDPNDPASDTTAVEPPDPATPPDEPVPIGVSVERGQPSTVLVAVSGVTEDGGELARSAPVPVSLADLQTYRVRPRPPVGVLANARFSAVNRNGKPDLWTLRNLSAANYTAENGGLEMRQPTIIGSAFPAAASEKPVPVTPDTTARIVGSVAVLRRQGGAAQIAVEELDEAGAVARTTVLKSITSGKASLGAKGFRIGAGTALPWHADAVSFRVVGRMALGADASVNMDMRVEGLEVFDFDAAPRPFERLDDGSVNFAPAPTVPHPDRSHYAAGEAPIPSGAETETPDPALSIVTFESGAWNPTAPVSGSWGALDSAGGATGTVSAAAAIFGANGIEVKSDSTANQSYYRYRYDGGAGLGSLALRSLVGCSRLTRGEASLHRISDASDNTIGVVRRTAAGAYVVDALGPGGGTVARRTVLSDELVDYDVEIIVDGGNTKDGRVAVAASRFGSPREILAEVALDLTGRRPRYARALVTGESNVQAKWTFRFDQVVPTLGGDLQDRESPALPAGETPEDPDAPLTPAGAGTFRLNHAWADENGEAVRVRQEAYFGRPGTARGTLGPRTTEPIPVKPGQTFTLALFAYLAQFGALRGVPSYPFGVLLRGTGKEPLWLGSPFGEAGVGEVPWREFARAYSVPAKTSPGDPGYTECWIESREMGEVYMLWQEGLFFDGDLTTTNPAHATEAAAAAARDAERTNARRTSGSARVTLDTRVPYGVHTPAQHKERRWGPFGVAGAGIVDELYRSGPTKDGPWTGATADKALVPEDAFLDVSFGLASDGTIEGEAEVPPGGVYLSTLQDIALLQNADGEDLPGLAVIGELLPDFTRGDYSVKTINGKPFAAKVSDDVRRLPGFAVSVYTEQAARTLLEASPNDRWRIPDPHADEGRGRNFLVRFSDLLEIEDKEPPTSIRTDPDSGEPVRRVLASFAVPWAHVLEAAPLGTP